jgi:hypothetical protein
MSKYEMLDYDELQRRIGITPGETWHCGSNPAPVTTFEEEGVTYDDVMSYTGASPLMAGGFCLSEDINVNGLLLNHRDDNNTLWLCTEVEGWWTIPPSEIPDVPKPFWDGSLLTTGRYLTRTITISGVFIPPDASLVWYNRNALIQASSIVRGVGLLTMCGNESDVLNETLTPFDPFYDPPKMTLIQTADTPLIDTTRANGFTQFSLSFRCVNPAKLSLYEKSVSLPMEDTTGPGAVTRERLYRAFSLAAGEGGGDTTEYTEVRNIGDPLHPEATRRYGDVENVNLGSLIEDEQYPEFTPSTTPEERALYYRESGIS